MAWQHQTKKTKTTWAGLNHMPLTPFTSEAAIENVISQSGATEHRSVIYLHFWNVCLGKAIRNITWVFLEWNQYHSYNYTECPFSESSCSCWGHFFWALPQCPPAQQLLLTALQAEEDALKLSAHGSKVCLQEGSAPPMLLETGWTAVHVCVPSPDTCAHVCPSSNQLCMRVSLFQTAVHSHVPSSGQLQEHLQQGSVGLMYSNHSKLNQRLTWTFFH